jgi:hypothetical protein
VQSSARSRILGGGRRASLFGKKQTAEEKAAARKAEAAKKREEAEKKRMALVKDGTWKAKGDDLHQHIIEHESSSNLPLGGNAGSRPALGGSVKDKDKGKDGAGRQQGPGRVSQATLKQWASGQPAAGAKPPSPKAGGARRRSSLFGRGGGGGVRQISAKFNAKPQSKGTSSAPPLQESSKQEKREFAQRVMAGGGGTSQNVILGRLVEGGSDHVSI